MSENIETLVDVRPPQPDEQPEETPELSPAEQDTVRKLARSPEAGAPLEPVRRWCFFFAPSGLRGTVR